ncbi:AAA family ATPase [Enterococcus faecium]|uniref:AAA family ATPase n=3 Tax=Enterococcus faecium TaxID=1352 RepID=UPI000DE826B6|nr:AAA family ATPase [Enterococcus faecium]MEB5584104.1 AAA family ATPase [Enterococcus faecium]MEB7312348.1 AAA family ATPase [Enterococcus faecium]RBS93235.1 hypothetical protein EB60_01416 [Enterococcus faecium]
MAKSGKIILARAGSGKTYHIANAFDEKKSVLFITFTNQNVANVKKEIMQRFNNIIPNNIEVITYSSFLYSWIIRPLEAVLPFENIRSRGVDIFKEPVPHTNPPTKGYITDDKIGHYLNPDNNRYYSGRMSKLIIKNKKILKPLIEKRLSLLVDTIYIDEFQDFKGEDFDLLMLLMKSKKVYTVAVGDFYQHSVAMTSSKSGKPYKKQKVFLTEEEFCLSLPKSLEVDREVLKKSRRVPSNICSVIEKKLGIDILSCNEQKGSFKYIIDIDELEQLLIDEGCVKLVYRKASAFPYQPAINWSYCKGDTYSKVLVILTEPYKKFSEENYIISKNTSQAEVNKLYVALTRSNNELYICTKSLFDLFNKQRIEKGE